MEPLISRRSVLAAGAGAAATLALPGAAAHAGGGHPTTVGFVLNAETLDGGEQVIAVTLDTGRLGPIDPASLTTGTFSVHAKATSPIPIAPGDQIFSEYDLDRTVTAARLDRHGNIVLELSYAEGQLGGGTLGYILSKGRNVRLDLTYTITQNAPLRRRHGGPVTIGGFVQGRLANPEVDAFSYHVGGGLKYRLYSPRGCHGRRPLIVWLHGGGEGASLPDNYYDNETTLRANRGALGFATAEAQRIFGGAYVVAPQSTSYWIEDGPRFAPQIREIIGDLVRRQAIDLKRILVVGCSNGGYMSIEMTTVYPDLFAASVPICGVVAPFTPGGPPLVPDSSLVEIGTPTWLVASLDDDTVDPQANTIHAHDLIPHSLITLYDHVIRDGHQFPGHWSWIYVARNDPSINGTHIWQWMAQQRS
ncbi:prolyl oligopeptidase family serine peptidase [Actinoplanes sp. KI2]|uniref:prolyl oligopeptidase family serine peptidase n=1 Tax=Actinoplanes sp. KI2 TaxID=2983315 RepID=UPI0021D59EA2|nr:prolyl oligopeptidase family serine peptidase [Actinoplanes sp. KI2]MCU7724977.1 prolyl oligopeptidase family serine peptidase [Actinoplanes sp. KI2]